MRAEFLVQAVVASFVKEEEIIILDMGTIFGESGLRDR
jgi:hypothetical protein